MRVPAPPAPPLPLVPLVLAATLALQKSNVISDFENSVSYQSKKAKGSKTYPIIVILLSQELAVDLVFGLVSFGAAVAGAFLVLVAALALQKSITISDFENSVSYPI